MRSHESDTVAGAPAHSATLCTEQKHPRDRGVFGLLRGGSAAGAATVSAARHAAAAEPFMWTAHAADKGAEAAPARAAVQAAGRNLGRVGCPHGPPLWDFHDGFVASATGLEV